MSLSWFGLKWSAMDNCMKNNVKYQHLEDSNTISQEPTFGWMGHGEKDGKQKLF